MKRIIILLFTAFSISSYAQNTFPTSNAIWNYKVSASDMFSEQSGNGNVYYTICGDTIMNDMLHYKLYTTLDTVICGENLEQLLGCFRQDGQKIYFAPYYEAYSIYPAYFEPEFLLYDFGVSIGDTVSIEYGFRYYFWRHGNYQKNYHHFMDDINNRLLIVSNIEIEDGIKRITLGNGYDIWHEGIGSIFGLFNAGKMEATDGYSFSFSLNCFKENDTVKYINNPECNKCFCKGFVAIKEEKIDIENINFFPNPAKDILNINSNNKQIESIEIFDMYGKLILSKQNCNLMNSIDISYFASSIYILKINTDDSMFVHKFVKE